MPARTERGRPHRAALALCAALLPCAAGGDAGSEVARLRGEPLSLFDWGVFRLEEELQGVKRHERDFLNVSWDAPLEQLLVEGTFFVEPAEIAHIGARDACYTRLHAIKLMMGVIDTDRIHFAPAAEYRLGVKFAHRDPGSDDAEAAMARTGRELMESLYIKVGIGSRVETFPFMQDMRCEGELMSQDVHYGKEGQQAVLPAQTVPATGLRPAEFPTPAP